MEYTKPTYDEYCKASKYAVIRYKFGVYIQIVAAILLLFLVYYTVTNIEEMKANPLEYAEEKMNIECIPMMSVDQLYGGIGDIRDIKKE